jgi:lipopolysaccharide export system permease protein
MTILDRYILGKHAGPFLAAIVSITFLFVMRVLVDYLDLFASRHLDPWTITEIIILSLGWIFALTFPMAVLVAVVMAFGRLAEDSELDAMQAGGISFVRTITPIVLVALALTVGLFYYNNVVLPNANHRLKTLTADIHKMRPTIAIREGVFIDDFDGYRLLVRRVDDEKNLIYDVTIYVLDPQEPTRTVHAPWGELLYSGDGNQLIIRLHDGEIHEVDKEDQGSYFLLDFQTHDIIFDDLGTKLERRAEGGSRGDRELSTWKMAELSEALRVEIVADTDSLRSDAHSGLEAFRDQVRAALEAPESRSVRPAEFATRARVLMRKVQSAERRVERKERDINRYQVEIHKKYAFPVACLVFVLLGAPLGASVRRGGFGTGAGISFAFFLLYYTASLGGEKLGDRGIVPPAVGMWAINVVLGLWGLWLIARKDGRKRGKRSAPVSPRTSP